VCPFEKAQEFTELGKTPKDGVDAVHTFFVCETLADDYTTLQSNKEYMDKFQTLPFDAGVFCLALMASDSLERGLLVASQTIKPGGAIYIVLDPWKLGINYAWKKDIKEAALKTWKEKFENITGFKVAATVMKGSPVFVYVELANVGHDMKFDDLKAKLKGVTLKGVCAADLADFSTSAVRSHAGPSQANPPSKKRLGFGDDSEEGPPKVPRSESA